MPGLNGVWIYEIRSVPRDGGATPVEAVIDARSDHIDVLTDAIRAIEQAGRRGEGDIAIAHEQVIVFDADRPVRCETKLKTGTDRATPTRFTRAGREEHSRGNSEYVVLVFGYGRAALYVKQHIVPGVANLTSEQPKRIDARTVTVRRKKQADIVASEISPVALRFQTEHPRGCLPAIADLTTSRAAGCVMATFPERRNRNACGRCYEIPAFAARSPAAIGADVEAAPIVKGGHHRWRRLGVRTSGQIGGRCGGIHAKGNKTNCSKQKLLHCCLSISVASGGLSETRLHRDRR